VSKGLAIGRVRLRRVSRAVARRGAGEAVDGFPWTALYLPLFIAYPLVLSVVLSFSSARVGSTDCCSYRCRSSASPTPSGRWLCGTRRSRCRSARGAHGLRPYRAARGSTAARASRRSGGSSCRSSRRASSPPVSSPSRPPMPSPHLSGVHRRAHVRLGLGQQDHLLRRHPARGIVNRFMKEVGRAEAAGAVRPFPLQNAPFPVRNALTQRARRPVDPGPPRRRRPTPGRGAGLSPHDGRRRASRPGRDAVQPGRRWSRTAVAAGGAGPATSGLSPVAPPRRVPAEGPPAPTLRPAFRRRHRPGVRASPIA
jgi:hypothetical protein